MMLISIQNVCKNYWAGDIETAALKDINLEILEGSFTAIVGHTGSGKSTLIQHLNGLLLPEEGRVVIADFDLEAKKKIKNIKALRKQVGIVFQFPEYQLFEETVEKDIAFGPSNLNLSEEEINIRVKDNKLDITALENKIKIVDAKIKNAALFIEKIEEHKKSIFEFWKFTSKDEKQTLAEGEDDEDIKKEHIELFAKLVKDNKKLYQEPDKALESEKLIVIPVEDLPNND